MPFRLQQWTSCNWIVSRQRPSSRIRWKCILSRHNTDRGLHAASAQTPENPLRKRLKDDAKLQKASKGHGGRRMLFNDEDWELTVGIEIHAELDTARKLFSSATTSPGPPNTRVALFDLAYPGTQPSFQIATLIPAIRAALALGCEIQPKSSFDRKHYFYPDQPAGYQITQFYEPFAKEGSIILHAHEGIDPRDGSHVKIGIKQIQMEQDTAKSTAQTSASSLLDFNRVSHPLIEIITLPEIHYPATAAAFVRKVQKLLKDVGAVTAGMESGGMRADVNVSVRRRGHITSRKLGTRTEIKNLISFKSIEEAIIAECDRHVHIMEEGHTVLGETRGWSIGSEETTSLRGKEGEVDYRYMPDPDLSPVIISKQLIKHLQETMPTSQEVLLNDLVNPMSYGLVLKDAKTLMELDGGDRLDYFIDVCNEACTLLKTSAQKIVGRTASNLIIHEVGALLTRHDAAWSPELIPAHKLAALVEARISKRISSGAAKKLLVILFGQDRRPVNDIIEEEGFLAEADFPHAEAEKFMRSLLEENFEMVKAVRERGETGKISWFVGQGMRWMREKKYPPNADEMRKVVHYLLAGK